MAWYSNKENIQGLINALSEADILEDRDDVRDVLNTPQKYDEYFRAWAAAGYPGPDDNSWDDFVSEVTNMVESESDEDNDEDEDEDEDENEDTEESDDESEDDEDEEE